MRLTIIIQLIITILLCKAGQAADAKPDKIFRNFTTDDGLPSSETYQVIQDKKGYIWIATEMGVSRYNGEKFTNYTTNDGLIDNSTFEIFEDWKGRIWFVSYAGKISFFYNDSIYAFEFNQVILDNVKGTIPIKRSFFVDSLDNLYISYYGDYPGSFKISSTGKISTLNVPQSEDYNTFATFVSDHVSIFGKHGNPGRILIQDGNTQYLSPSLFNNFLRPMCIKNIDESIVLTNERYIWKTNHRKEEFSTTLENEIIWVSSDDSGRTWIGTLKGGAICYNNYALNDPVRFLNGSSVSCVLIDNNKGLWCTTLENGVYFSPDFSMNYYSDNLGLNSNKITCVEKLNGELYAAGYDNNICIIKDGVSVINLSQDKSEVVNTMYVSEESSTLYFGTNKHYYVLLNSRVEKFETHYSLEGHERQQIRSVNCIYPGSDGILWCGTSFGLQTIFNDSLFMCNGNIPRATNITAICETPSGSLFLATSKGLMEYKPTGNHGRYGALINHAEKNSGLNARGTSLICISERNEVWMGTKDRGIIVMKIDSGNTIKSMNRIKCGSVRQMKLYDERVWIASNNGILILDLKDKNLPIRRITKSHGLVSNEVNYIEIHNDTCYAATNSGISLFPLSKMNKLAANPKVYINKIKVNNRDTVFKTKYYFKYDENTISMQFEGLSFNDPEKKFVIRLDKNGKPGNSEETSVSSVHYSFLSPGKYSFFVWAVNEDNNLSDVPAMFLFDIDKPYWQTWWFVALIVFLFSSVISTIMILINRMKIKELKARLTLIREKDDLERQVKTHMQKALSQQMNPHFIFNTLNSIQYFIIEKDKESSGKYLHKFAKLMRTTLENSQDFLLTIEKELECIKLYLEIEAMRFNNNLQYEIFVAPDVDSDFLKIPTFIIQPVVENAVWHGLMPKGGGGMIKINVLQVDPLLKITVEDDGIGRKAAGDLKSKSDPSRKSFSKNIIVERLNLLSSLYNCELTIEYFDLTDHEGNSKGTKVEFYLPLIS